MEETLAMLELATIVNFKKTISVMSEYPQDGSSNCNCYDYRVDTRLQNCMARCVLRVIRCITCHAEQEYPQDGAGMRFFRYKPEFRFFCAPFCWFSGFFRHFCPFLRIFRFFPKDSFSCLMVAAGNFRLMACIVLSGFLAVSVSLRRNLKGKSDLFLLLCSCHFNSS